MDGRAVPAALRDFHSSSRSDLTRPIERSGASVARGLDRPAGAALALPEEDGFVGRLMLPLRSEHLAAPPSREMRDAVERSNASVLGFLLQEVDLDALPRPGDERLAAALAPMRTKLDMLIEMVTRLSYRNVPLPPVGAVELGPSHIVWHSRQSCPPGDWLRFDLYFNEVLREPVTLFAAVSRCPEQDCDDDWRIEGRLTEMPAGTRERLQRVAFLAQRQQHGRLRHWSTGVSET
jgi:hypothetical protein